MENIKFNLWTTHTTPRGRGRASAAEKAAAAALTRGIDAKKPPKEVATSGAPACAKAGGNDSEPLSCGVARPRRRGPRSFDMRPCPPAGQRLLRYILFHQRGQPVGERSKAAASGYTALRDPRRPANSRVPRSTATGNRRDLAQCRCGADADREGHNPWFLKEWVSKTRIPLVE